MIKKIYGLAISLCLSIILHAYLTNSYFQVRYGDNSGTAICNIGDKFNCEAVSASQYAQFMGIPMATWGLGLNLTLFILLLGYLLSDLHKRQWFVALQLGILASGSASIVMLAISLTMLTTHCLFCIFLHVLAFLQIYLAFSGTKVSEFKNNLSELFNFQKVPYSVFIALAFFPVSSAFINAKLKRDYGGDRLEKQISSIIESWKSETNEIIFANTPATLTKPSSDESTKFEIVEFADFLCGHCQRASKTIKTFLAGHKANFRFYTYPLDQTCRTNDNTLTGPSCYLAKTVYCADQQSLGWQAHDWVFARQNELMTTVDKVKQIVKTMTPDLGLNEEKLVSCIESEQTHQAIVAQSQFAQNLNITGTPTIYVNGKKLKGGQMLDVLRKAYDISIDK